MRKSFVATMAAAAVFIAGSASAAALADFQLNGTFANSGVGAATMTSNGGVLGATGLTFGFNEGPTISGLGTLTSYSLITQFRFDDVSGYRRIVDFSNRASDNGLYTLDGDLDFFPVAFGTPGVIGANELVTVRLTRATNNVVTGYINGASQWSFVDTAGEAIIHDHVNLFLDDFFFANEASSGFVNYATISDSVPEPAAWGLMILGFAASGVALRRRRVVA